MSLKGYYRDTTAVAVAALVLSTGGVAFWRHVAAPIPTSAAPQQQTAQRRAALPTSPGKSKVTVKDSGRRLDNELIARRNLFRPFVAPKVTTPSPPVQVEAQPVVAARPLPPSQPSPPPSPRPTETQNLLQGQVAVVGFVIVNNERLALVEDLARDEARTVREGETAFGYRVTRIDQDSATLERDGNTFRLALGENKPRRGGVRLAGGIMPASASNVLSSNNPSPQTLQQLPPHLQSIVAQVLPAGGRVKRVQTQTDGGQLVYRVEKELNGLDYEVRMTPEGRITRMETELLPADLPPHITAAANGALEGYTVNLRDKPSLHERDGQRYYEVEVRNESGKEVDLRITPDGTVIGRD